MAKQFHESSEAGILRRVISRHPDKGIVWVDAKRSDELLNPLAYVTGVNEIEQTIITLSSGELSGTQGSSHCMSCPIERASV